MRKYLTSSMIVSTYNWPEALELVLLSISQQSVLPDELIIADDGSGEETEKVISKYKQSFPTQLVHVWHEDKGFRLAEIRNKAIAQANFDYIIQIDGDIILHRHFIKDHLLSACPGYFITGSRVLLNEQITLKRQSQKNINFTFLSKGIKNRFNAIHFPYLLSFFEKCSKEIDEARHKVRGCNMSFWKEDLIEVNGYDENITGWGREDSELSIRLVHSGKVKKRIKFGAVQFHQYHPTSSKASLNKNEGLLLKTIEKNLVSCADGLKNHL
ncbi:MAG: glycosyltransferase family 2 protein [Bacteroidota bacterium]